MSVIKQIATQKKRPLLLLLLLLLLLQSKTNIPSVTKLYYSDGVVNVVNCRQHGDWAANSSVVTMLPAVNNGDTLHSLCSPSAA